MTADSVPAADPETAVDAAHLGRLYARLDHLRDETARRLARTERSRPGGSPQNLSERDAYAALYADRLAQLEAVEDRLAFGRLDTSAGGQAYVGRIGLSDDAHTPLLVDWRAPAAEPFYRATAANPMGVARRRHLLTTGRTLTGVEDEVLDPDAVDPSTVVAGSGVHGDSVLLAAIGAARTGRMSDIVATIQAEQDEVVRAGAKGVLVVQGGPGTGKTAVALHRAAYLLYTHRDRLERSGVLLVGPSPVFLRYISRVLPSLGETGVVTTTMADLLPGITATDRDEPAVAAVKGHPRMVSVLRAAVRDRQRLPAGPIPLEVEGRVVVLRPDDVAAARSAARRTRRPHNAARRVFVRELLARLRRQYARQLGMDDDSLDHGALEEDLRESRDVRREVNLAWMPLTAEGVLADLYADPDRLARAGGRLDAEERALLRRDRGAAWTVDDVPLLDELADLLGEDGEADRARARAAAAAREAERRYAAESLRSMGGAAAAMVSADLLAARFAESGPGLSVAERAATDRTWTFGHVVVDEAQEMSPMMWRALHRRCPSRSMTLVGDVAQTSHPAGAGDWARALDPWAGGSWRVARLSVNYRTPARIMRVAAEVLRANDPGLGSPDVPRSAREGDHAPRAVRVGAGDPDAVAAVVRAAAEETATGRTAVITTRADLAAVADAVALLLPGGSGSGVEALDLPVAVLATDQAKGLEFDTVVVVEPADILAASVRGAHDLYVALTRPTQRLVVVHARALPAGMESLAAGTGSPADGAVIDR